MQADTELMRQRAANKAAQDALEQERLKARADQEADERAKAEAARHAES